MCSRGWAFNACFISVVIFYVKHFNLQVNVRKILKNLLLQCLLFFNIASMFQSIHLFFFHHCSTCTQDIGSLQPIVALTGGRQGHTLNSSELTI